MKRLSITLVLSLLVSVVFMIAPAQGMRAAKNSLIGNPNVTGYYENKEEIPLYVKGRLSTGTALGAEAQAVIDYYRQHKDAYHLTDPDKELQVKRVDIDDLGMRHARVQQMYRGIPVRGGVSLAHFDRNGVLKAVNGKIIPGLDLDVFPDLTMQQARESAWNDYGPASGKKYELQPELIVFPWEGQQYLAWRLMIRSTQPLGNWEYFIDAHNGEIIYKANRIMDTDAIGSGIGVLGKWRYHIDTEFDGTTYHLIDRTRTTDNNPHGHDGQMPPGTYIKTYNGNGGVPGSEYTDPDNVWEEAYQAPAVDAQVYSGLVYDWMLSVLGRNSFNDLGSWMIATVEWSGDGYDNAVWNGEQIIIYKASQGWRSLAGAPDVVAHEWAHGVTQYTSGLWYEKESGALNESFSDMMGSAFELDHDTLDAPDWNIGENASSGGSGFRDMSDPPSANDPDYYGTTDPHWIDVESCTPSSNNDWCGVHTNSGVGNKWFYLVSDGGTHHDVTVDGIGVDNAALIAYRSNRYYWTPNSTYLDAALGAIQAAADLDGSGVWQDQVTKAWEAVGVYFSTPQMYLTDFTVSDATYGDGDGTPEAGETIQVAFEITNYWQPAEGTQVDLSVNNEQITITKGSTFLGLVSPSTSVDNSSDQFELDLAVDYTPHIDSFFLTVTANSGDFTKLLGSNAFMGWPQVLAVDDDNGDYVDTFYTGPLYAKRQPYQVWDKQSQGSPDSLTLSAYDIVYWFTGDYRSNPLTAADIDAMRGYMNQGGKLWVTGQGIAAQLATANPTFLNDYLRADYTATQYIPLLYGLSTGPVFGEATDYPMAITGGLGASNQTNPDNFNTVNGSSAEMQLSGRTDYTALTYDGSYKLIFMGFGFEAIRSKDPMYRDRDSIYNRVLDFFSYDPTSGFPLVTSLGVGPGDSLNLLDHTPTFTWSFFDQAGNPQSEYQVQVSSNNEWSYIEMWDPGVMAGTASSIEYAGATLEDGKTYYARVRMNNGSQWSAWRIRQFRMNAPPPRPVPVRPLANAVVGSATPVLENTFVLDPDGDAVTYEFEVYEDAGLTTLAAHESGFAIGFPNITWTVNTPLTDNENYFWRVRSYDNYEYSAWTDPEVFWVNSVNEPPLPFSLVDPPDGDSVADITPTFTWHKADDDDPFDSATYTLRIADNPSFLSSTNLPNIKDTTYTPAPEDAFTGGLYYWKVFAIDQFSGQTESQESYALTIINHGDVNLDGNTDIVDAVYIINWVFKGGAAPDPLSLGDVNCDDQTNISDGVYIVNWVFRGGPEPCVPE